MRVLLIGHSRWTAEGLAAALRRAASPAGEPLALQPLSLDEWQQTDAAGNPPRADLVVLASLPMAATRDMLRQLPADLPALWLAAAGTIDEAAELTRSSPARPFGCLRDDANEAQLHAAIQAVSLGLSVHPAHVAWPVSAGAPDAAQELRDPLTARELEVFELMAKGLGNRDIASALGISSHTAKFHVAQILDKTGSATRTEAVHHGLRLGLVGL